MSNYESALSILSNVLDEFKQEIASLNKRINHLEQRLDALEAPVDKIYKAAQLLNEAQNKVNIEIEHQQEPLTQEASAESETDFDDSDFIELYMQTPLPNLKPFLERHQLFKLGVPQSVQSQISKNPQAAFYLATGDFHYVAKAHITEHDTYWVFPKIQPYAKSSIASVGLEQVFDFILNRHSGNIIVNIVPAKAKKINDTWQIIEKGHLTFE